MSVRKIIVCDNCKQEKKEVNHWFSIEANEAGLHVATFESVPFEVRESDTIQDLCGANCVSIIVQKWLTKNGGTIHAEGEPIT